MFDAAMRLPRPSFNNLGYRTQSLIDCCRIGKDLCDIRVKHDDVCSFGIWHGILPDHCLAEIILIQHFNFLFLFLAHNLSSHATLLAAR